MYCEVGVGFFFLHLLAVRDIEYYFPTLRERSENTFEKKKN